MESIGKTPESATSSTRPSSDIKCFFKEVSEQELIVHEKTRGGSTRKDKHYIDPKSGLEFFSEKDAVKYIEDGNTQRCMKKPRQRNEEEVLSLISASKMASGSVATAEVENPDLQINPAPLHDQKYETPPLPEPESVVMQETINIDMAIETPPSIISQSQLPMEDSQIGVTPIETEEFIIPYDVTSYPFWDSLRELEDEAYWANWAANHNNTHGGSPSNAPSQNLNEDNRSPTPADDDNESSSPKK